MATHKEALIIDLVTRLTYEKCMEIIDTWGGGDEFRKTEKTIARFVVDKVMAELEASE